MSVDLIFLQHFSASVATEKHHIDRLYSRLCKIVFTLCDPFHSFLSRSPWHRSCRSWIVFVEQECDHNSWSPKEKEKRLECINVCGDHFLSVHPPFEKGKTPRVASYPSYLLWWPRWEKIFLQWVMKERIENEKPAFCSRLHAKQMMTDVTRPNLRLKQNSIKTFSTIPNLRSSPPPQSERHDSRTWSPPWREGVSILEQTAGWTCSVGAKHQLVSSHLAIWRSSWKMTNQTLRKDPRKKIFSSDEHLLIICWPSNGIKKMGGTHPRFFLIRIWK